MGEEDLKWSLQGQLLMEGWDTYGVGSDFIGMGKVNETVSFFSHFHFLHFFIFNSFVLYQVNRYFLKAQDQLWRAVLELLARFEYRVRFWPDRRKIKI